MNLARTVAGVGLALVLGARWASAGSISIGMTSNAQYLDGALTIRVSASNSGDEAASAVVPVLRFGTAEVRGTQRESLAPGESLNETLSLAAPDLGPGRWPYRVAINYADANQYPFQAMHVGLFPVGTPGPAKVALSGVTGGRIATGGTVTGQVKNLSPVQRRATVTFHAPEGLEVDGPPVEIDLAPWGEDMARASLVNRTALEGSRYPLFVVAEYQDEDGHHAVVATGLVEIAGRRSRVGPWLGWTIGALFVVWIVVVLWALRRRRAEA